MKYLIVSFSAVFLGLMTYGQDVRIEKDFDQTFPATAKDKVEISNKYGEVIVHPWSGQSVRIRAIVSAQGKNQSTVSKNLDRVRVKMQRVGALILARTEVEQSGGAFSGLLDDLGKYSKSLFGSKKLTVNYEVWIPEGVNLSINNRYGDVFLGRLDGEVEVTLAHGDLRSEYIGNRIELEHSYGKCDFDYVRYGKFILRGSEVEVDKGSSIHLRSSSSEVDIRDIGSVHLNSRNDAIRLDGIAKITGEGRFTDVIAQDVRKSVQVSLEYGEITLERIARDFESISIDGTSTDVQLMLNQASFIHADITGDEKRMLVPNSMLSLKRDFDPESGRVTLSGDMGYTQDHQGKLTVRAHGGDVIISVRDTPIYTENDKR